MPPKRIKIGGSDGKITVGDFHNPRVILGPLRADSSGHSQYHVDHETPIASLYNKPELSDLKLKVGDNSYYTHRLVLCATSVVFNRMLGPEWLESEKAELELQEEEECVKVFDRFLYYFYTGKIIICDSYVIPLFILADKYDVKPLYNKCIEVIGNGLKVYVVRRTHSTTDSIEDKDGAASENQSSHFVLSSSSSGSESSDSESREGPATVPSLSQPSTSKQNGQSSVHLVASETFPLSLVMNMLVYCHNEFIASAALHNLQARLATQIKHNNYGVWNDLDQSLLVKMLANVHFYCPEYTLYKAAKSWLQYLEERQTSECLAEVLNHIRFPLFSATELYLIEKEELVKNCSVANKLLHEAIRYKLFKNCHVTSNENWTGSQFEQRMVKKM